MNTLLPIVEAARLIQSGASLAIAGSARALSLLPAGKWIGGTSCYFIGSEGAVKSDEHVFVTELSILGSVNLAVYGPNEVARVTQDAPEQGFSLTIIPAGTVSLRNFAQRPYTSELFLKAVIGWISGVDLADLRAGKAQVVDGGTRTFIDDGIVVAHVTLPADKIPSISIVNPFQAQPGDVIHFENTGFSAVECLVNGKKTRFAEYLVSKGYANGRLPLIGDYSGAGVNVSIQAVECVSGRVDFYAPVFQNVTYRLAAPVSDYATTFRNALGERATADVAFSCNCILNYMYGELEGKRLGNVQGPVTFGEIAYQLLNQTMVMLEVV
jgi:hypothetical protein